LLAGLGYQTLQSLVLDFYKWAPNERLLDALLSMLVDGKFELNEKTTIKASTYHMFEKRNTIFSAFVHLVMVHFVLLSL
jgi:hypothetical protein